MGKDMINFMQQFVKESRSDESLSGFFQKKAEETSQTLGFPANYFFLTSLCDPMNNFVKIKLPKVQDTIESIKRKKMGDKLHFFAKNWFKKMEGFESSESHLDGIHFGLPVSGRIDAKVNGSIIELKTKEIIPSTIEEIFERCPGDIEQLGFYSVLDPTKPVENYLLFLSHGEPSEIKAFKVKIKDHNKIKGVLHKRIEDLTNALRTGDPSKLGSCRYCWEDCPLKKEEFCKWSTIPKKECEISDFIEISEDTSFADKFKKVFSFRGSEEKTIPFFGMIMPRKYFHTNILELEDPFEQSAEEKKNKSYIRDLAFNFKKSYNPLDKDIPDSLFPEVSFSKNNWIKYISSSNPEGEVIPFIACVNDNDYEGMLLSPPKYRIAELGIIASVFKKSRGLIFIYYPKADGGKYRVFRVDYSFNDEVKERIKKIIGILKAEEINSIKNLPICPYFLSNDNCIQCKFKESCLKEP